MQGPDRILDIELPDFLIGASLSFLAFLRIPYLVKSFDLIVFLLNALALSLVPFYQLLIFALDRYWVATPRCFLHFQHHSNNDDRNLDPNTFQRSGFCWRVFIQTLIVKYRK